MAGSKIGGQQEEFERLLILAEEDKAQTPKAKEALKDWREKYDNYGAAMYFSPKQWDWLKSLAGEDEDEDKVERRTVPKANSTKAANRARGEDPDDDIPF